MTEGIFGERGKALENYFFSEVDKLLLQQLREQMNLESDRAKIARAVGFEDDGILDRLEELGIAPVTISLLAIIPLLAVAWADGDVHAAERKAILDAAHEDGMEDGSPADQLLQRWLEEKPDPKLIDTWESYIKKLSNHLSPGEISAMKKVTTDRAHSVAMAAGGILGMGNRISPEERKVLEQMQQAFDL